MIPDSPDSGTVFSQGHSKKILTFLDRLTRPHEDDTLLTALHTAQPLQVTRLHHRVSKLIYIYYGFSNLLNIIEELTSRLALTISNEGQTVDLKLILI